MANTVNQPDGSSVTVIQPPGAAAAAAASVWTVEYEVDFTAQAIYDFVATGATRTIGGAVWTAVNRTATDADVFDFDGSTGLRINAKGAPNNNGHWYGSNQSQPYFWATLDDMITGTALAIDDTLCLQLEMTTTSDVGSQWQRYGLGLWKDDAPAGANNFVAVSRFWNGSAACNASIRNTTQDNDPNVTQPDFFEIVSYPAGAQVLSCGSVAGGAFPDPLATTTYQAYNSMNQSGPGSSGGAGIPSFNIPFDKAAFVITCQVQGSSTALNSTAKKMRVLRRNRS